MGSRPEAKKKISGDSQQFLSVSRRELLAGTAAALTCTLFPVPSLAPPRTAAPAEVLASRERGCLEAMVSRLIPAGADGPGAIEAGCARYIEHALGDAYQLLRKTYNEGLAALHSCAMARGGESFAALSAAEQDQILSDFERNVHIGDYGNSAAFFEMVRRHTLEGMFGDPSYGGNANFAGWDLIGYPGPRMYVSPELEKMEAKLPRSRVFAKQLVDGSR